MNTIHKKLLTAFVLATLSSTTFAESVDISVIGTIVPTACTPSVSGGGNIDYGTIKPSELSDTDYTVLTAKQLDFTIACNAAAKLAVKTINGRPNSLAGATESADGSAPAPAGVSLFNTASVPVVGLGLSGTDKIGGYAIRIASTTVTADGQSVDSIQADGDTTTWSTAPLGVLYSGTGVTRNSSWAAAGTLAPIAFTNLVGKLEVQAYINLASELDLSGPVNFDGLTTIELVYL